MHRSLRRHDRRAPVATGADDDAHPDTDSLTLPSPAAPPTRSPVPVLSALVPVAGALVLWAMTGSVYSLWFAALGPLLAAGSTVDSLRAARRARRRSAAQSATACAAVAAAVQRRHADERGQMWARHPDVARFAADPSDVWRVVPGRSDAIVVGRGRARSSVTVGGGDGSAAARAVKSDAAHLEDAPILVDVREGIAVVGPAALAAATVRAFALQVCLTRPPGDVRILAGAAGDAPWSETLPHRTAQSGLVLHVVPPDEEIAADVDIPIVCVAPGAPPPPRCGAVLTLTGVRTARLDHAGGACDVVVEAVTAEQAHALAVMLARRARATSRHADRPSVALDTLLASAPAPSRGALPAVIGLAGREAAVVDLVADGPHAIVTGVTGSGKSELLTTWIAALCATHSPQQVAFLLADFKGGRAFDALADLPHVTGVLTDLDDVAARRAIDSLRAELRRRERTLAAAGARDVSEIDDGSEHALARLVIVVDEYAALIGAHASLADVFVDIAARGRALGMHLILSSQRATGVFRDAVLANCPLRLSLRVTDAADSRVVLGTDGAALLPGGPAERGLALLRRPRDHAAASVRVVRTDIDALRARVQQAAHRPARRPWLPELPRELPLDLVRKAHPGSDDVLLGLIDEPEQQRQCVVCFPEQERGLLVIGGAAAGKTNVLALVAAQCDPRRVVLLADDAESVWDATARLESAPAGTTVLIDDADALAARYPPDYAVALTERIERLARDAGRRGIRFVVTGQRMTGLAARLAPLLPRHALLALPSKADHVAAGGEVGSFVAEAPPGRAMWGRDRLHFALAPQELATEPPGEGSDAVSPWRPRGDAAVVTRGALADVLRSWTAAGMRVVPLDAPDGTAPEEAPSGARTPAPTIVWGDPEAWLRSWRLLESARTRGALLIDASCGADVRALTGSRDLPPYAEPASGRAWLWENGGPARRVIVS